MIRCPCCNGFGMIEERAPVKMSPMQFRIYDIVRRAKHGIEGPDLVRKAYAHLPDGGPLEAGASVRTMIYHLNKRLAAVSEQVRADTPGAGALYRIVRAT